MLRNVERDEVSGRGDGLQRVEVKPLVLEASPPRLDEGIRERDLGDGKHTAKKTGFDQCVDLGVDVLYSRVGENIGGSVRRKKAFGGLAENRNRVSSSKMLGHLPRQDSPGEIVDDGVETLCVDCLHPKCQPRLKVLLANGDLVYVLELATTSALNLFDVEAQARAQAGQLIDWNLRLTVIDRGRWGEVVFELTDRARK